jgi:hypothetical protein
MAPAGAAGGARSGGGRTDHPLAAHIGVENQHEERTHFPGPWRVDVTEGGHFVVKDATGFCICYVYARKDGALRSSYMTPAEAVVIAEAIARVPDLLTSDKV